MPNYQKGKIYKIVSPSNPDVLPYFGATTQMLCSRMTTHRKNFDCSSKQLIGCGDAKIVLVENYPCKNKEELSSREAQYILNNDCCNKIIPFRPPEYLKEYTQKYRNEHKEERKQYDKKRNRVSIICECGGNYTQQHKQEHYKTNLHLSYIGNATS